MKRSFATRLRERKIVQWALAYLAGAWLALQVMEVLGDILTLPLSFQRGALVVLGFGFLIALVLAWYHGEQGRQRASGPELLLVAGVLVAAGATLGLVRGSGRAEPETPPPASPAPDARTVAILPFADLSPQGDQEYLGDGIAEELMSTVAQIPELRVTARTSSFAFKGSDLDVREIGARLGVARVVEGSVRKSGDQLRIEARLIDVADGFRMWSDRFDADLSDIFAVQDEIARAVAAALRVRLAGAPDELTLKGQTRDHVAQDLYLRGRFEWNRRTQASLERAVEAFGRALARDSSYARALVGLGDAYAVLGFYDYRPPSEAFPRAKEAARRALEIEDELAEPHATLGYAALYYDWDWEEAERRFLLSISLNPDYPVAHQWYANYLVAMGRFEEAATHMRTASELDPLSMIAHAATGWVLYYWRDYEGAVAQLERSLARDPNFELAHLWMGQAHEELGNHEEASRLIERAVSLSGGSAISRAALAHARAGQGRGDEARRLLAELESEGARGYIPSYEIARARAGLGEADAAVRWLERAHGERAHSMAFLAVDPQLAPLHGHPGYRRLLGEMRLGAPVAESRGS